MKRRAVLLGALLTLVSRTHAQQRRMPRIAFLSAGSAAGFATQIAGLRAGLKELGYVEGKTLALDFRWAEGRLNTLPQEAAELVRLGVDVIVTQGIPATRAAKEATKSVPIVMAAVGDAVAMGIVPSLAKPAGNITGLTFFAPELVAKRLELLKAAMPQLQRVGYLFNPDNPIQRGPVTERVRLAARSLKVELEPAEGRASEEFENAVSAVAAKGAEAVMFSEEPTQLANARRLVDAATKRRLPCVGPLEFVSAGATLAYGVHFPDLYRRAAYFVDKILKGVAPADLPVEQATRFEFAINVRAAKAIGLSIPAHLVPRADRVIE
jgi:putative ABC transport system substrate-binding protein